MITPVRRVLLGLSAVAVAATTTTACGSGGGTYDTLCVDPLNQIRMPDTYCLVGNPMYQPGWLYYVPMGYRYPAYGGVIVHYNVHNYHRPHGTVHTGGLSSTGGTARKVSSTSKGGTSKSGVTLQKKKTTYTGRLKTSIRSRIGRH